MCSSDNYGLSNNAQLVTAFVPGIAEMFQIVGKYESASSIVNVRDVVYISSALAAIACVGAQWCFRKKNALGTYVFGTVAVASSILAGYTANKLYASVQQLNQEIIRGEVRDCEDTLCPEASK